MTPTGSEQPRTAGKFYTRAAYQAERKQKLTVISGPRLQISRSISKHDVDDSENFV